MLPSSKELERHIVFGSLDCPSFCYAKHTVKTVIDRVLKFSIWNKDGKHANLYVLFCPSDIFLELGPFFRLMHCKSCEIV